MTKSKKPAAKRITAEQRKDWRNLPTVDWNVRTFHVYFADMNAEIFGAAPYLPMRNWAFEQAQIKRAIEAYGPDILRAAFDEAFRTYRPTREYPLLTAGFACSYRINAIIPALMAERADKERAAAEKANAEEADYSGMEAWL
ncbi:hypothetical protein BBD42_15295 [Paenibacillus sp. BIHB 4019]|uniref:Uncharacterized protein n=1 Tax=Paenibacillus sp. BIHB 4019 TaxID=1870819 RepID=A0A1B2DIY0_9BACL|nr:hypothetical protein [Paenibacillus sp. BIHB 4019]ANY67677.1 hypothetical protein BBD42_15295 [Paenibacillus sp. BIHB 4019]